MFSIFTYVMSRVTHSEPGLPMVCFVIAYNFNGKYAPEAGKTRKRTAFFTRATKIAFSNFDFF